MTRVPVAPAILIAVAAALLLRAQAAGGQAPPGGEDPATAALRQGDNQRAIALAEAALGASPRDCRMLAVRGLALKRLGREREALASFERAQSACPRSLPALEGMAEIQYAQGSPEAIDTLRRILALQPDNPTSHAMLGVLEWRAGDCARAAEDFGHAGALIPSSPAARMEYGSCLLALGENEQAMGLFRQALDRNDAAHDAAADRLRYAYACWRAKAYAEASTALAPLVDAPAPDPRALRLAAEVAESGGDTPQAVALLRRAILADPKETKNYLVFAEVSFDHRSFQVGVDMLDAGLRQTPGEARLYLARGVLEVEMDRLDEAMSDFRQAHRLDPRLSFAEDAMGMMLTQHHQSAASLAAFAGELRKHPDDPLLLYLYAEALRDSGAAARGSLAAAVAAARHAVALEPDYQPARDLLCVLELDAGNLKAVVEQAEEALKRDPYDQMALYQEIAAYRRMGRRDGIGDLSERLRRAHQHQEQAKTNYQLQEIDAPSPAGP